MSAAEVLRYSVAIAGSVTDAESGSAMSGVTMEITGMPASFQRFLNLRMRQAGLGWRSMTTRADRTRTRPDGLFYFADLPDGEYEIAASASAFGVRYGRATQRVTVKRDAAGRLRPVWISLALPPTLVRGSVLSRKVAVTLAEIRVQGSGERAYSDAEGKYVIAGIEPGTKRTLLVFAQGYKAVSKPLSIQSPGDAQTVDFSLVAAPG